VIPLRLDEIAGLVGGALADAPDPAATVTGTVEFDSRQVTPGGLFVALPGERVDGHDYAGAAVAAGAVAALTARPVGVPAVVVPDVLDALATLAHEVLARLPELTVIGVTGSSGKTSTKDLLAHVLGRLGPTVAPPGSFNNELGHPYTVLRADRRTRYLVLENSARGVGHIAALCGIAPPRIGVVLNVGSAHLGEFGSREAIASAKGELVEALPAGDLGGVAVLNADDPLVAAMAARTTATVRTFGLREGADVRAIDASLDERGRPHYTLVTRDSQRAPVHMRLYGEHHIPNSLAVAAVALELGMPLDEVAQALSTARAASRWRMEVTDRADGVTVINDAYNANPESMRAALHALTRIAAGRRAWAVLGQMAELGEAADAEHAELGREVAKLGIARLVVVGEQAAPIHAAAVADGAHSVKVADAAAATELLRRELHPPDVVLVKASRAAALERVALEIAETAR
jgi:UDP-N-acetylmuramoyl-tripeptide--D-alanyl-D-alanine ligase